MTLFAGQLFGSRLPPLYSPFATSVWMPLCFANRIF
jgi:hypothetical protein